MSDENDPLYSRLKHPDIAERRKAVRKLVASDELIPVTVFAELLQDREVRYFALPGLRKLPTPEAVKLVVDMLADEQYAVSVLVEFGTTIPGTVDLLLDALQSPDSDMRVGAVQVLTHCSEPRVVNALITCLKDENEIIYPTLARSLAMLEAVEAVEPLLALLHHRDWIVRREVALALGYLGDSRAFEPLLQMLATEKTVRDNIIAALGYLRDKRAAEPLFAILINKKQLYEERMAAARSLSYLGETGRALLNRAFAEGNKQTRDLADFGLIEADDNSPLP